MGDSKEQADKLKTLGNIALRDKDPGRAAELYTQALKLDPDNHLLYSNRSAARCAQEDYGKALEDADKVLQLKPDFVKGYTRKGAALCLMSRYEEAMDTYSEGLNIEPDNQQLKEEIDKCKSNLTGPAGSQPMVNPFGDPNYMDKIRNNSQTREYLNDPAYVRMITQLHSNPKSLGQHMQDHRIMSTLGVLLGVDLQMMDGREDSPSTNGEPMDQTPAPSPKPKKETTPAKQELSDEKKEALKEKELGNAAYKKKDFETAISHYSKAIELDPTNIVFKNNRAAVYFEQGEYDTCIKECQEAVEIGRENRADFKHLAKALARTGTAYLKQNDMKNALLYYNKSLSEHRDPDIVKKAIQVEKEMKERAKLDYVDPEKALEEKEKGNKFFTKGDYPSALKHYTEAIKRNPDDAKLYSNRAACYTKLAEFSMALRDSDMCVKLDPKFVKGYLRQATSYLAMKETSKAAESYQRAMEVDPNCQEAVQGYRSCLMEENNPEAVKKRAMSDPEVQAILADPAMQIILSQMQKDPGAVKEHLQNPQVAKKIEKLLEVGLIAIR